MSTCVLSIIIKLLRPALGQQQALPLTKCIDCCSPVCWVAAAQLCHLCQHVLLHRRQLLLEGLQGTPKMQHEDKKFCCFCHWRRWTLVSPTRSAACILPTQLYLADSSTANCMAASAQQQSITEETLLKLHMHFM
jgi:hypothetical protein